jgi:hypothetical protein
MEGFRLRRLVPVTFTLFKNHPLSCSNLVTETLHRLKYSKHFFHLKYESGAGLVPEARLFVLVTVLAEFSPQIVCRRLMYRPKYRSWKVCFLTFHILQGFFRLKIQFFVTKSDQDPDPHWFDSLDPIRTEIKSWIQIHTETNANAQHWLLMPYL